MTPGGAVRSDSRPAPLGNRPRSGHCPRRPHARAAHRPELCVRRDLPSDRCGQGSRRGLCRLRAGLLSTHDILFDAMERRPGTTALLVVGYGDDDLRADADRRGLDVEIVGPPGVDHDAVNRLINRARVGVVCGQHDGAPAILTEYQLAGLPVLANADLVCGLDHVPASAGTIASPGAPFAAALDGLLASPPADPRPDAIARWGWRASIARLGQDIDAIRSGHGRSDGAPRPVAPRDDRQARPDLPVASAVGFRDPAAPAPDGPLCPRLPRAVLGGGDPHHACCLIWSSRLSRRPWCAPTIPDR